MYYNKAPYEAIKHSAVYHKYEVKSQKSGMSQQKHIHALVKPPVWLREDRIFNTFFYLFFHRHLKFSFRNDLSSSSITIISGQQKEW